MKPKGQLVQLYMDCDARKPVSRVFDKSRLKPVSSPTETSSRIKISLVASLDKILSKMRLKKALISLRECAGWSAPLLFANPRRRVSRDEAIMILCYKDIKCSISASTQHFCTYLIIDHKRQNSLFVDLTLLYSL